jgi:Raf kinase inhibitor-like YbhB/YbcL family protein
MNWKRIAAAIFLAAVLFFVARALLNGSGHAYSFAVGSAQGAPMPLSISSTSFPDGGEIPKKFTCDAEDVSPQLSWTQAPINTKSFALIADDPDAPVGTWTHWVLFDLPESFNALAEGVPKTGDLPVGGRQGMNDFRKTGYGGPCPPPGKAHRYFFRLFALDSMLGLKSGTTRQEVEKAMKGHVLAQAEWMGKYHR